MADETTTQPPLDDSRIENVDIEKEVQRSYIDYAMSVIVGRALPDVRDGLKLVHQRILWGMLQLGVRPGQSYRKCAKVVGEVMGTYHPHGDTAIYDALARMAQDFTMRYPLVDGKGNFGSLDGDPPGAMRYCVTGDTRVWTPLGSRRISELAELAPNSEADIETKVLDKEGIPVLATKLFHSGTHPTIRIRTREGYELTGTPNHPVLCLENVLGVPMLLWKLLSEVAPGTFVAMSKPEPEAALKWGFTTDKVPFLADYIRSDCGSRWVDKEWLRRHNIDRIARWESRGEEILSRIASAEVRRVIRPLVSGRYYFAEVVGVEDAGFHPVYSIRVDSDDHSFVTNGFVSHNTECRLHPLAMELLADIDEDTVNFRPNYDGSAREPMVLPARFPNLLVNGSTGIAVGMATNIPPHNLGEVIDAVVAMIDDSEIKPAELMKLVKGPDFPLGGIILGREGIKDAYTTGRGSVKVRAKCEVEETKQGRQRIIVTELPYMVSGDRVLLKVADLVKTGKMQGISDLRNESNRQGIRLVIELKRDAIPQVVLNNLYKHTQLQDSFGIIMLALVDGVPKTLSLAEVIHHYIDHQVDVVTRRTKYRLRKAEERMHILEGLLIALRNLDTVIKLIRESKSADDAREKLMKRYKLTEIQANAILDMQLRRLAALERQKIREEATELAKTIKELQSILKSPQKLRKVIKDELAEIRKKFADARRTTITAAEADFDIEDLIPDEEVILTNTRSGYIKRTKAGVYKTQGRGGRGIIGANPKEGDIVDRMLSTTNHAYILIFSSRGKVYRVKAHEVPEKERTARGTSIRNILPFTAEEQVAALIDTRDFETHKYLVIATKKGIIKKTAFGAYDTSRRDGIIALNLRKDDEVVQVRATSGEDELIMVSRKGMSIRFAEADVRPMGRTAGGVIGMRLSAQDEVVSFDVVDQNGELLIVTDAGYGKRTLLERYPRQKRGGKGVKTAKLTGKRGSIQGAGVVRVGHEVFLIASDGQVIRMTVRDISRQGRDTTGVRVMRFDPGTTVAAMAPVVIEE